MTRPNGEAPSGQGRGLQETHQNRQADFSLESRRLTNLISQFSLNGHAVHKGQSGDFLVCKYGLSRHCQNFEELQAFARKLGVTP